MNDITRSKFASVKKLLKESKDSNSLLPIDVVQMVLVVISKGKRSSAANSNNKSGGKSAAAMGAILSLIRSLSSGKGTVLKEDIESLQVNDFFDLKLFKLKLSIQNNY